MKKTLIMSVITLLSLLMVYGLANAVVSGSCANCHTMHGYQGGVEITWLKGATDPDGPYGALIKGTCLGCHTTAGSDPYPGSGTYFHYPFVKSSISGAFTDTNCLAGGFFPVTELGPGTAHTGNAHTLGSPAAPVGYTTGYTWYKGTSSATGLTCSGSSGCHGSQTIDDPSAAISGGHHGTSTYGYRILAAYNNGSPVAVLGGGAGGSGKDYEKALIAAVTPAAGGRSSTNTTYYHNIYKAAIGGTDTISQLCANCHGLFHSETRALGAWIRHPTDVELPTYIAGPPVMWEPSNDTVYNNFDAKFNPYGFTNVSATTGTKMVTCLSCHRVHGTEQYDILRFKYTEAESGQQQAGRAPGTIIAYGCLGCHSGQR
jgi:Zn-finger protein